MAEWLSYSLTDLLMFTPETYARLFELYNATLWPVHVPVAGFSLWLVVGTRNASPPQARVISLVLAGLWAAIAWFFFAGHYATINLAAPWFAWGFAAQALLLAVTALARELRYQWRERVTGQVGLGLLLVALIVIPIVSLASRSWRGVELFGMTPDPTAVGTLGLLLMLQGKVRWLLLPLPLLWGVISALTYVAMATKS